MKFMAVPRCLDIEITTKCNLRCFYCSHFSSAGDVAADLSTNEWFTFFDELKTLGLMEITLSGGEPFLRKDIREIIQKIIDCRMRYSILTNGTLITDELARFLKDTNRLDSIQISIDGTSPKSHDVHRGKGSLEKAVRGIEALKCHDIVPTVRLTIHNKNVDHLGEIVDFLLNSLELPSFSTNSVFQLGQCADNPDICLSTEKYSQAMASLTELNHKYPGRIQAQAGPLADAELWQQMITAADNNEPAFSNGGRLTGCGCVFSKLAVRADGGVVPCTLMGDVLLGYINKQSLKDIWQNHPALEEFRERRYISLSEFQKCSTCRYQNYCTGNCPALAASDSATPHMPSREGCLLRFLESGGVLPPSITN